MSTWGLLSSAEQNVFRVTIDLQVPRRRMLEAFPSDPILLEGTLPQANCTVQFQLNFDLLASLMCSVLRLTCEGRVLIPRSM